MENNKELITYEMPIIAEFVGWELGQTIIARYVAWKINRKWKRYQGRLKRNAYVEYLNSFDNQDGK